MKIRIQFIVTLERYTDYGELNLGYSEKQVLEGMNIKSVKKISSTEFQLVLENPINRIDQYLVTSMFSLYDTRKLSE